MRYTIKIIRNRSKVLQSAVTLLLLMSATAAFTGCGHRPGDTSLPVVPPESFSVSGTLEVSDQWWCAFENGALNALVDQALAANFDLKTAWQRLKESRAMVDRESSALFPYLNGSAEGETRRAKESDQDQLQLGFASEYEVDLWGRIKSRVEAEKYRADAALADYQTAALSLSAEIVRAWYQLMAAQNERTLLEAQIEAHEKVLHLLNARFSSGQTRSVDILRQRQLLEATRQQKYVVEARIRVLEHQLAILAGQPPQEEVQYRHQPLPGLPPMPETGLPAALVHRRPDVKSAYHRLKAADRDLAAAISNQYPRLNLTASVYTTSQGANRLFEDWARVFTGELTAPLFDAGQRAAEVDRTAALKNQRLYEYGQAILTAFQEVENALIREKKQIEVIQILAERVDLARKTYGQLRIEYLNGVSNFIDVLLALTNEQQLRRNLITEKLALLEYRIALYRALAGGFEINGVDKKNYQDHMP